MGGLSLPGVDAFSNPRFNQVYETFRTRTTAGQYSVRSDVDDDLQFRIADSSELEALLNHLAIAPHGLYDEATRTIYLNSRLFENDEPQTQLLGLDVLAQEWAHSLDDGDPNSPEEEALTLAVSGLTLAEAYPAIRQNIANYNEVVQEAALDLANDFRAAWSLPERPNDQLYGELLNVFEGNEAATTFLEQTLDAVNETAPSP